MLDMLKPYVGYLSGNEEASWKSLSPRWKYNAAFSANVIIISSVCIAVKVYLY